MKQEAHTQCSSVKSLAFFCLLITSAVLCGGNFLSFYTSVTADLQPRASTLRRKIVIRLIRGNKASGGARDGKPRWVRLGISGRASSAIYMPPSCSEACRLTSVPGNAFCLPGGINCALAMFSSSALSFYRRSESPSTGRTSNEASQACKWIKLEEECPPTPPCV